MKFIKRTSERPSRCPKDATLMLKLRVQPNPCSAKPLDQSDIITHLPSSPPILIPAPRMSRRTQLASRALQLPLKSATKPPRRPLPASLPIERRLSAYLQHTPPKPTMSFLLPDLRRGALLATPLILSSPLLVHNYRHSAAIRCDAADPLAKLGDLRNSYSREAQTPVITQSGAANPRAVRQISMGSILGVVGGLGVSVFSKPLAILIGLGVLLLQVRDGAKNEKMHDART